jgi:methionine-gamma-lyase
MAAMSTTVFTHLSSGDHLIADDTLYGCTRDIFEFQMKRFKIDVTFADLSVPGTVASLL